jgi:hypothetical protein
MAEITQKTAIGRLGTGLIVNDGLVVLDEDLVQDAIDTSISNVWKSITGFTATPASTSTITTTTDWTGVITINTPLRYTIDGVDYYGIVTAITASLITVAGAPLSDSITALAYSDESRVCQVDFFIAGKFADATNSTLLASDMGTYFKWTLPEARLVHFFLRVATDDSGAAQPNANINVNSLPVCTSNSNAGLTTAESFVSTVVDINTTNYVVTTGLQFEISTDATGTNKDSVNLTITAILVVI